MTLVAFIIMEQFQVIVHLIDIKIALRTKQELPFAVVAHVPRQSIRQHTDVNLAKGTLLLLRTARARSEVPLFVLVVESVSALVRTIKLADVQHVDHVPRHFHLPPFSLAVRTVAISGQPLSQTWSTNESLAIAALSDVFEYIRTDATDELLHDFLELWL